jgi:hypothetical protein
MKKSLIIKIAIVVVILMLSYCVFWFFKAGQAEKQINKFVSENSTNVSIGSIAVSGFPVSQKIVAKDLKIILPITAISKRQIIFSEVESHASIFSSDFSLKIVGAVKVQDLGASGESYDVEFLSEPVASFKINNDIIEKFNYSDGGFKIVDLNKNIINSTSANTISIESAIEEGYKTSTKVTLNSNDITGYSMFDFYKNTLEKKVIEGIKTDEIKVNLVDNFQSQVQNIGVNDLNNIATNDPNQVAVAINSSLANPAQQPSAPENVANNPNNIASGNVPPQPAVQGNPQIPAQPSAVAPANVPNAEAPNVQQQVAVNPANPSTLVADPASTAQNVATDPNSQISQNNIPPVGTENIEPVKNNLTLSFVINTTQTIKQDLPTPPPSDPTQIQELPVQFVKNIKIENFTLKNSLFNINILGDFNISSDDNYPSGSVAIKVENSSALIEILRKDFASYAETKKPPVVNGPDVNMEAQAKYIPNYDIFLDKVSKKFIEVSTEVATKNSVSKDQISQFDIRREKNLEFLVNEVPVREIVGKFTN